MDWITAFGLGIAIAERTQKTEAGKRAKQITRHRLALSDEIHTLETILCDLSSSCTMSMEQRDLTNLKELVPLFPLAEILSLQGYIGIEQEAYLQVFFATSTGRYSLDQFKKLAIERMGRDSEWNCLAELNGSFCGQIWQTLIELLCRQRTPELLQQMVNAIGTILYHFRFLENTETLFVQTRYQEIINALNFHANECQKTGYLHAVMLLQDKLSETNGGSATDFEPRLNSEEPLLINGETTLSFSVYGKEHFLRFYAVRKIRSPDEFDFIWELPAGGTSPEPFFAESY